jgi:diguanylate cyclase (GGDEF)-like protein
VPLRWVYPLVGAAVAGVGTGVLSTLHAEPFWVSVAATLLFVMLGWMLGQKQDGLRQRASTDSLTGVANRRIFDHEVARAASECARTGVPVALLFVDVDKLKAINDELGHAAGDAALRLVGECLARTCRSRDLVARWGGDEFAVLAHWTSGRDGLILAQRIRETLAQIGQQQAGAATCPTVSIGIAEMRPGTRPEGLLVAADEALYQAKLGGRDRAVLAAANRLPRRVPPMKRLRTRPMRTPTGLATESHGNTS